MSKGMSLGETKPLDTHVNSEIWLYFTMQKNKIQKISQLKKGRLIQLPPPSEIMVKENTSSEEGKGQLLLLHLCGMNCYIWASLTI